MTNQSAPAAAAALPEMTMEEEINRILAENDLLDDCYAPDDEAILEAATDLDHEALLWPTPAEITYAFECYREADAAYRQAKIAEAGCTYELKVAKNNLTRANARAIANWDSKEKKAIDPEQPFNDATSEEKRAAAARDIFPELAKIIDGLEADLAEFSLVVLDNEIAYNDARHNVNRIRTIIASEAVQNGVNLYF